MAGPFMFWTKRPGSYKAGRKCDFMANIARRPLILLNLLLFNSCLSFFRMRPIALQTTSILRANAMSGNVISRIFRNSGVLRRLFVSFMLIGIIVGVVFPILIESILDIAPEQKLWFYMACVAAGVFVTVANSMVVHFQLLKKLTPVSAMAQALSQGDISERCDLKSNDMIGHIAVNMNTMAETLQAAFTEIGQATQQVGDASTRLKHVSDETDACLQNQQQETEQVVAAMDQMTSTFQEVVGNAERAADASSHARAQAQDGALVATEAIGGLDSLVSRIGEAASVVDSLRTDSDNIGTVLDVIRGIAEQTNLLALNAAIEAARAGEQGRGFAVVADEVRTLASRTQQSTQEIQTMIEALQANTVSAVDVMHQVKSQAEESSGQVEHGAEALAEIAGAVSTLDSMNAQIAQAAEQQSTVSEEINKSIYSISESTEQTAAGTQQTASSSEQLNGLVMQLRSAVSKFH